VSRGDESIVPIPDLSAGGGLTIREHFAGLAMQCVLSCDKLMHGVLLGSSVETVAGTVSELSVMLADALISELAKEPK
jgi:hypothetical protein